jgi:hypothetical protein
VAGRRVPDRRTLEAIRPCHLHPWGYYAGPAGDRDHDGRPDTVDPYPDDASNNSAWWAGGRFDINSQPVEFAGQYHLASAGDMDEDGIPDCSIGSIARILAHEFGHYLMLSMKNDNNEMHDNGSGKYPAGTAALMRGAETGKRQGRWIRKEDWRKANKTAKDRMQ